MFVFSGFALRHLKNRRPRQKLPAGYGYIRMGFIQTWKTIKRVSEHKNTFRFLLAFMFYANGAGASKYQHMSLICVPVLRAYLYHSLCMISCDYV